MKRGDKCRLINPIRLEQIGLKGKEGSIVILDDNCSAWAASYGDGSYFHYESDPKESQWWATWDCFELLGTAPTTTQLQPGDKAVLTNLDALRSVSMGGHISETVTLETLMSYDEKLSKSYLREHIDDQVWWITIDETPSAQYYVPAKCLRKLTVTNLNLPISPGRQWDWPGLKQTKPTKKETKSMYIHTVAIIKVPSQIAQQAGAIETFVVPTTEELANDGNAAIAMVAAKNAEAILALEGKSMIRVVVKNQG